LRARSWNPKKKKFRPPAIAIDERIVRWLIGIKKARQTVTEGSWIYLG
jgi:hypothetical protein